MITIEAIQCKLCGDIIFSRANYDYHRCTCKAIAIDGGHFDYDNGVLSYGRYASNDLNNVLPKQIELDVTEKELYDDWNTRTNKYGIIKTN